ncbi:hypothetical protein [Solitalea koreensis]|uniref:ParB/Sulfiredoxin domain-containing protein n=1 Tax=Solitalea koreensis TaxID=543615 RepID=A0A521E6W5_9SPHI|nr:hypothetical protein [Solitalea koreensis]SMO79683.1 hypothetical protein SAMN06265350_1127 [Solitalea koreensis]
MARTKKIKLTNLLVNTENYRFETVASQKEALDKMLDNQNDFLFNLAEHIMEFGLNPNDSIQVIASAHDKNYYIVLEGNRRTTCLKFLNNPDLIEGAKYLSLKRKFKKLNEVNKDRLVSEVDCVIYDDPKEADIWIGLKHGYGKYGTGTDGWDPLQKQRFGEKTEGKTSTSIQIIKLLKASPDVPAEIKSNVEKINTTNLDRLIDDPDVRTFLGIEFNNGTIQSKIDEKEVVKGLTQVVKDILDPKFTVKKIYDKDARKDYIQNFHKASIPDTSIAAGKLWQINSSSSASPVVASKPASSIKSKPIPTERKKLIPKTCGMSINNPKVNAIYHELMDIDVTRHTNAVAVLFRVFVELSVDSYVEEHSLTPTPSPSAAKSGMNLQQKINVVANHLDTKKWADQAICKGVKSSVKDSNDILGLDTWHAYVHNNRFSPKAENLIITWDNMQDFMVILWNNIK